MIRGCHKSIVFLKDTGSELFDEAYFIIKPGSKAKASGDIVYEATRLVNSLTDIDAKHQKKRSGILAFILGVLTGAGLMLLLYAIL